MDGLEKAYFEWLCDMVNDLKPRKDASYERLLTELFYTDFEYTLPMDANRFVDGIDMRYRFGYECGVCDRTIAIEIDIRPCCVLEMMIALAARIEEGIMLDPEIGRRTGKWFWEMILNLGLGQMTDRYFSRHTVQNACRRFMDRDYEPNGKGGLFTLYHRSEDMRNVDIWYQAMWYLTENYH